MKRLTHIVNYAVAGLLFWSAVIIMTPGVIIGNALRHLAYLVLKQEEPDGR